MVIIPLWTHLSQVMQFSILSKRFPSVHAQWACELASLDSCKPASLSHAGLCLDRDALSQTSRPRCSPCDSALRPSPGTDKTHFHCRLMDPPGDAE